MTRSLRGKTVFITGASRGIGRAIALRCARDGANVVVAAKTVDPHPRLKGTVHTVAAEVEAAGGHALALALDVREDSSVRTAVELAVARFGSIDVLVNNASALHLAGTAETPMRRFDLMMDVNLRGTFACSQASLPYLAKSTNAHILNLAPPPSLEARWFSRHTAYTISKFGMSLCTLGMAAEFADRGIAVNSLWPRTTIATAAIENNFPAEILRASRQPEIVADAAHVILNREARAHTGNFYIDEAVLRAEGVTDFEQYAVTPGIVPFTDLFLD